MAGENIKPKNGVKSFSIWMALSVLVVAFDHLTKWMIVKWVPLYDKIPINGFINITHQRNTGAAFSFLADAGGWQKWFFIVLAVAVSAFIVAWLWRIRTAGQVVLSAGLALVLGGAIGNVIDRIVRDSVVDFIQVLIAGWPFPSFNIADSAITAGIVLMLLDSLLLALRKDKGAASEETDSE